MRNANQEMDDLARYKGNKSLMEGWMWEAMKACDKF